MVMEYGVQGNIYKKNTKVIIAWIKNQVMVSMNGKMVGFIREILIMTSEMEQDNFMTVKNLYTEAFGETENTQMKK